MDRLCYLQYLTIVSFHRNNPEFEINIHYPCKKSEHITWDTEEQRGRSLDFIDYLDNLKALPYVKWHEVDMTKICNFLDNDSSEVFKSDFLRIYILHKEGGVWSDIDILYNNSISNLMLQLNGNSSALLCCDYDYYIGFIASTPESKTFEMLLDNAEENFNPSEYQSMGSAHYGKNHDSIKKESVYFHPLLFYPFGWTKEGLEYFFYSKVDSVDYEEPTSKEITNINIEDLIGIHWCNGNSYSQTLCRHFNHNTQTKFSTTTMGSILDNIFSTDENYHNNNILQ
tara:strand:+ start:13241 stop:14092 length:852 start_codon:yes stop_codon:yes gene_type:complete